MALLTVKRKFHISDIFVAAAVLTFLLSATSILPRHVVESGYSRFVFPTISHISGAIADAIPFSWLDLLVVSAVPILLLIVRRRRWRVLAGIVSGLYLVFFWTWGLNYHRGTMENRLGMEARPADEREVARLAVKAASELNRLWPLVEGAATDSSAISRTASERVGRVVFRLDGTEWIAARRIKHSWLADPWFRMAGIEGMFNPLIHEPIVASQLLAFELPFVMSHELAHGHGYPDEGDANFVALLSTVASNEPLFQYSAWIQLWLYLRTQELDGLLEAGPRRDLLLLAARVQSQQVRWVNGLQNALLDLFLKANNVPEGIRSYGRLVNLAVASRERWDQFSVH